MNKVLTSLLFTPFTVALLACAPPKGFQTVDHSEARRQAQKEINRRNQRETTGYETILPTPGQPDQYQPIRYTPSGDLDSYEKLAEEARQSQFHNPGFAQKIKGGNILLKSEGSSHNFQILLNLEGHTENLRFAYSVTKDKILEKITTTFNPQKTSNISYQLISQCENEQCRVLKMTLQEMKNKQVVAEASLLYTVSIIHLKTLVADPTAISAESEPTQNINEEVVSEGTDDVVNSPEDTETDSTPDNLVETMAPKESGNDNSSDNSVTSNDVMVKNAADSVRQMPTAESNLQTPPSANTQRESSRRKKAQRAKPQAINNPGTTNQSQRQARLQRRKQKAQAQAQNQAQVETAQTVQSIQPAELPAHNDQRQSIEDTQNQQSEPKKPADNPSTLTRTLQQINEATKGVLVVVDGIAQGVVTIFNSNEPEKPLFVINTPVGETFDQAIPAEIAMLDSEIKKNEQVSEVQLQGNNPETGEMVLDIAVSGAQEKVDELTRLRLILSEQERTKIDPTEKSLNRNYRYAIFPITTQGFGKDQLPTTFNTTYRLESYRQHDQVKKYIEMWTDSRNPRIGACKRQTYYSASRAKNFLTQMNIKVRDLNKTLGELTSSILNKVDSPPQMAYLAALESNYWKDFDSDIIVRYNSKAGDPKNRNRHHFWSDASGPYGCLTDTCRGIIHKNSDLLKQADLDLKVFYVTPMEREMYRRAVVENKTECVGRSGAQIKCLDRGTIRRTIYNMGKEQEYAQQRKNATLLDGDARKYFATSTLMAGLEVRRLLYDKKAKAPGANGSASQKKFEWTLREDPVLAILSYHSGEGTVAKASVCAQLPTQGERHQCQKSMKIGAAVKQRHRGFPTTFADIAALNMAKCDYLDYTWAWLALQFIGANPDSYGVEIGTPSQDNLGYRDLIPEGLQLSHFIDSDAKML